MIWNFIIIGAVVIIFLVLVRKIPVALKIQKEEKSNISLKEINKYSLIAQADDAFDEKDFEKAENIYIRAAAQDPGNAKIYNRLGLIYLDRKNYYDAKEAFLQAAKLEADIALRHANLGMAYMGLKDYFKASQSFQKAVELDPKDKKYRQMYERAQKVYEKDKNKKK